MTQTSVSPVGRILRRWRQVRGRSQLDLAVDAGVSPRHVSFIETGRSVPSRPMLCALSDVLEIPLRERNSLFEAAGYAAMYRETPMDAPEMSQANLAIDGILRAYVRCPAVAVNVRYDILKSNEAAMLLMGGAPAVGDAAPRPNLLRLLLSSHCLRPAILNWEVSARAMIRRVQYEAAAQESLRRDLQAIIDECVEDAAALMRTVDWTRPADVVLPMRIRSPAGELSFFSTITTLGTPCDITLQELRIEAFHPADAATEAYIDATLNAPAASMR